MAYIKLAIIAVSLTEIGRKPRTKMMTIIIPA